MTTETLVIDHFDTDCFLHEMKDGSFKVTIVFSGFSTEEGAKVLALRVKDALIEARIINSADQTYPHKG